MLPQPRQDERPLVISKALLPFTRPLLYRDVDLTSWPSLQRFARSVIELPALGALVEALRVALVSRPGRPSARFDGQTSRTFWQSLPGVKRLTLSDCPGTVRGLLELKPEQGGCKLGSMTELAIEGDFGAQPPLNPLRPSTYASLIRLAPKLSLLSLNLDELPDSTTQAGIDTSDCLSRLDKLSLACAPEPEHSAQTIALIQSALPRSLSLYSSTSLDDLAAVIDGLDLPLLRSLQLGAAHGSGEHRALDMGRFARLEELDLSHARPLQRAWLDL